MRLNDDAVNHLIYAREYDIFIICSSRGKMIVRLPENCKLSFKYITYNAIFN